MSAKVRELATTEIFVKCKCGRLVWVISKNTAFIEDEVKR